MDDPTGGMWIYLIFLIFPLSRIIPRILKKYRKNTGDSQEEPKYTTTDIAEPQKKSFFAQEPQKKSFFAQEPQKKDGWFTKDDFN